MSNKWPKERLDALLLRLAWNSETGIFHWKVSPASNIKAGELAGGLGPNSEWNVCYRGKRIGAHRLVWYMHHRRLPDYIRHKNGIKTDNRIENLEEYANTKR